jgi:hypothetical protein
MSQCTFAIKSNSVIFSRHLTTLRRSKMTTPS